MTRIQVDEDGDLSAVSAEERAARFGQKPATVLLTGLTGSGKTAIGHAVQRKLFDCRTRGCHDRRRNRPTRTQSGPGITPPKTAAKTSAAAPTWLTRSMMPD